jgi:cleavage and polyadenylation specificity factor subunit 2
MGKIAVTEDVDGIRGEIDVGEETEEEQETEDVQMEDESKEDASTGPKGKCIPTVIEVQDAFEAMNTLRYSQPIHLQGAFRPCLRSGSLAHCII